MKNTVSFLVAICLTIISLQAQTLVSNKTADNFSTEPPKAALKNNPVVFQAPNFPGGKKALAKFIRDNFNYPEAALNGGVEGRIIVQFTITDEGKIINPLVTNGISRSCDREAIQLVKAMPDWIPAQHNGQSIATNYKLPLVLKL